LPAARQARINAMVSRLQFCAQEVADHRDFPTGPLRPGNVLAATFTCARNGGRGNHFPMLYVTPGRQPPRIWRTNASLGESSSVCGA